MKKRRLLKSFRWDSLRVHAVLQAYGRLDIERLVLSPAFSHSHGRQASIHSTRTTHAEMESLLIEGGQF